MSSFSLLIKDWYRRGEAENNPRHPIPTSFFYPFHFTTVSYCKQLRRVLWGAKGGPLGPCVFRATLGDIPWVEALEGCMSPAPWPSTTGLSSSFRCSSNSKSNDHDDQRPWRPFPQVQGCTSVTPGPEKWPQETSSASKLCGLGCQWRCPNF